MAKKLLSAIRATVRQFLRDEFKVGTESDFTNDELDLRIGKVLGEISLKRPYKVEETLVSVGTKKLDISEIEDTIGERVEKAEYPTGSDPPAYRDVSIIGNTLRINIDATPTLGDDVILICYKTHQLTEDTSTLTADLEDVLVEGVVAYAALAWCNKMRSQIVPQSYRWHQNWANNQYIIYQNSLRGLPRPEVWEFYPRG